VYGKSQALPFREDGDMQMGATDMGRWAYACSKAIDEFLAMAYWRERSLPTTVVRLFNTVGPRQTGSYGMVVPRLVSQALAGEPLTVFGDGEQTRCFCHVADVVEALFGLMREEGAYGQVFNVGATAEISILDLAERIIDMTGSRSDISLIPYDEAYGEGFEDMYRRVPDTTKVRELIDWHPTRSLEDVVQDVVACQRGTPSPVAIGAGKQIS
jgi:UDP-glucose 4-epimerase